MVLVVTDVGLVYSQGNPSAGKTIVVAYQHAEGGIDIAWWRKVYGLDVASKLKHLICNAFNGYLIVRQSSKRGKYSMMGQVQSADI